MEEEFYKDEFEQFLQQQANNHRMFPTDGVWLGIYKKLHGDKRWPGLTIAALAILVATVATSIYFSPKPNIFALSDIPKSTSYSAVRNSNTLVDLNYASAKPAHGANLVKQSAKPDYTTSQPLKEDSNPDNLLVSTDDRQNLANTSVAVNVGKQPFISAQLQSLTITENVKAKKTITAQLIEQSAEPANNNVILANDQENDLQFFESERIENLEKNQVKKLPLINKVETDVNDRNMADNFLKQQKSALEKSASISTKYKKNRFSYTVYVAPSVSYRKLNENKDLNSKSYSLTGPVAANFVTDVNKSVRHKPGTGIEAGFGFTYHLSNKFGITSGLQINLRQYSIEAFRGATELTSIALLSNSGVDTINSYAIYRNTNGIFSTELVNRYFQFSVPVGIVWQVLGNNKMQLNVAANIQPTYTFNADSYVLSTNFKNYTVNSNMLRNLTINSNIEAFLSLKVGESKWQIGPQVRYQHLPTFITEYPIREHLLDYGFKIGVSKPIK